MEKKVFFNGELGKVCGVLHTVENKNEVVILVHGTSSTKETSAKINAYELNKIGISALRIDLDNQGESDLDFRTGCNISNYIKQVEAAINFLKEKGFKEISLIGTSFGGNVVLIVALKYPEIKRLFLRASTYDFQKELVEKNGEDKVREFRDKGLICYGDGKCISFNCYNDAKQYSILEHAKNIKQPIMIIHGNKDKEVDYKNAQKIVDIFPNAKLHIIKNAGHILGVNGDFSEGKKVMIDFFSS